MKTVNHSYSAVSENVWNLVWTPSQYETNILVQENQTFTLLYLYPHVFIRTVSAHEESYKLYIIINIKKQEIIFFIVKYFEKTILVQYSFAFILKQ